jgi:GMP reductase
MEMPYKGPVAEVLRQIMGGLRSACAYVGADRLKDLSKCCTFVRCTRTHHPIPD